MHWPQFSAKAFYVSLLALSTAVAFSALGGCRKNPSTTTQNNGIDPALLAKAQASDPAAEFQVGLHYEQGQGVPQDYKQAAVWYGKAAEQGNAQAESNLGSLYDNGQGVAQDRSQAAVWYLKAADQGDAKAQYRLGVLYYKASGMPHHL